LDIAVAVADVDALRRALATIGATVPARLLSATRCTTAWGPLDVFIVEVSSATDVVRGARSVRIAT
jgi:hypothetical protein